MKSVPASGVTVTGIDLSHWSPVINWVTVKAAGIVFAFIKATEGSNMVDPKFNANWAAAKAAGLICGAYHYFHPKVDPEVQATNFVKTVGSLLTATDLPPVLDFEATDNLAAKFDLGRAQIFLKAVQKATGKVPIIYGSPAFLQALSLTADLANYPLWIAQYGVAAPSIPAPFTTWKFWQYSESATLPGVGTPGINKVDASYFNGTLADLQAFVAASNVKTAPSVAPKA